MPGTDDLYETQDMATATSPIAAEIARAEGQWTQPVLTQVEKIEAAIGAWLVQHIHNSPVAQSTPAFNHLQESLPALRDSIAGSL